MKEKGKKVVRGSASVPERKKRDGNWREKGNRRSRQRALETKGRKEATTGCSWAKIKKHAPLVSVEGASVASPWENKNRGVIAHLPRRRQRKERRAACSPLRKGDGRPRRDHAPDKKVRKKRRRARKVED